MKIAITILAMITTYTAFGQVVCEVKNKAEATKIIYVVKDAPKPSCPGSEFCPEMYDNADSLAVDWVVEKLYEEDTYAAKLHPGDMCIVNDSSQVLWKVFFTNTRSEADLVIAYGDAAGVNHLSARGMKALKEYCDKYSNWCKGCQR